MHSKRCSEDTMKRIALIAVAILGSLLLTACGSSSSTPMPHVQTAGTDGAKAATLVIQHTSAGCHNWSLNGSALATHQIARLQHGNGITVTDDDVMPHELIQTAGPAAQMAGMEMGTMGAQSTVVSRCLVSTGSPPRPARTIPAPPASSPPVRTTC
jgi:hypothetical protein